MGFTTKRWEKKRAGIQRTSDKVEQDWAYQVPKQYLDPRAELAMLSKRVGRKEVEELEIVCRRSHNSMNKGAQTVLPESGIALRRNIEIRQEGRSVK
jgi:hypothetical protein